MAPDYASCYNNIGVNKELLKDHASAVDNYLICIKKDKEYKSAYKNLSDVYDNLRYTQEQID